MSRQESEAGERDPHMRARRRPTVQDVAQAAGVSPSTVSRALNGRGYVAPDVRERVQSAATRIGYVADAMAQTLRGKSSHSVGVLISGLRNPFYASFAAGVEERLRAAGYRVILVNDDGKPEMEAAAVNTFIATLVEGVIVTPISDEPLFELRRRGVQVVQADRIVSQHYDAVVSENESGARQLTEHLLSQGHRTIALLIDEVMWTTGINRLAGYRAAHVDAGVPVDEALVACTGFDAAEAGAAVARLLDTNPAITAIFAANNMLAQGAFEELQHRGVSIPEELSLVAYDDVPWMSLVKPGITTVSQHAEELGRLSAETLVARLRDGRDDRQTKVIQLSPTLLLRSSTAAPPATAPKPSKSCSSAESANKA